jgi:heterotetrameric sarcosine oxidase delta subunit
MRIPCPYCGDRDRQEFTVLGEVPSAPRPSGMDADRTAMFAHVYDRKNVAGVHEEYWYHGAGCHAWLSVRRNTLTHEVLAATPTRERGVQS